MTDDPPIGPPLDRRRFLDFAAVFQGMLVVLAAILAWFAEIDPRTDFRWSAEALAWGVAGTAPLFALFLASFRFPSGPLGTMKRFLMTTIAPLLAACTWYDLILVALLAGVSEEILFRGVLQPWMQRSWGPIAGLTAASALFGLAHFITPTYALLAAAVGAYLGWLLGAPGERNLLAPIVTHALYDYLAFLVLVREYRRTNDEPHTNQEPRTK